MTNTSGSTFRRGIRKRLVIIAILSMGLLSGSVASLLVVPDSAPSLDVVQSDASNCAYIPWGDPVFTETNEVVYVWPNWMVAAFKDGGEWISSPTGHAWKVTGDTVGAASLHVEVDRMRLTNNAVLNFTVGTGTVASVCLDLYDSDEVVIVSNIWSDFLAGFATDTVMTLAIPFKSYPGAVGISLRCDTGTVTIIDSLLCIDLNGDNSDDSPGGHLDLSAVSTTNGIPFEEGGSFDQTSMVIRGEEPISPVDITDSNQNARVGGRVIYVEQKIGSDSWSGLVPTSRTNSGPKKTIASGCAALQSNDTLVIRSGNYNESLDVTASMNVRIEGDVRF